MRRILLAWEIGASFGHLARLIPIARHFQRRGDHVELAVRDPPTLAAMTKDAPLPCRAAPSLAPDPKPRPWSLNYADSLMRNGYDDPIRVRAGVLEWTAILDDERPDLVILEHAPGALLAAARRQVPRLVIGSGFSVPPLVTPQPTIQPWFDVPERELVQRERALVASINIALHPLGARPLATTADLFAGAGRSVCTWAEVDHYDGRPAEEYAGPLADLDGDAVDWPAGDGPRVFFYGRGDRISIALDAAVARGCRALVYRPQSPAPPPALPPGVTWLSRPADLGSVFAACDLAVCEPPGTATQFLLRGIPVLMLPRHLEQELWAYRVSGRGLAAFVSLFSRAAGRDVAAAFDHVLASGMLRTRAAAFAAAHASTPTAAVLARLTDRCEAMLAS